MNLTELLTINTVLRTYAEKSGHLCLANAMNTVVLVLIRYLCDKKKTHTVLQVHISMAANGRGRHMYQVRNLITRFEACGLVTISHKKEGQMYYGSIVTITEAGRQALREIEASTKTTTVRIKHKDRVKKVC